MDFAYDDSTRSLLARLAVTMDGHVRRSPGPRS
jgi:hypothetical protein